MRRLLLSALLAAALHAAGAGAQPAMPGSGSEPIEILSDVLTVEQDRQVATFSGNVQAVQGEMTLTAQRLKVFYAEADSGTEAAPGVGQGTQVTRIEADGNVRLSNPTDTAEGDRGVYDVAAQTVRLEGNVVLTSGDNVVRGSRLDMDLRTNVSTVRSVAEGGGQQQQQRVRALFVPKKNGS
jgi:lipopolysaccharide export system protein LptA